MPTPTVSQLLDAWESGAGRSAAQRAVLLLAAEGSEPPRILAGLPIGRRDARLLALREQMFGPHLPARADCPACDEQLEFAFDANDIRDSANADAELEPPSDLTLEIDGFSVRFRLPNGDDLAAAGVCADVNVARHQLLHRCLLQAKHGEREFDTAILPSAILDAVANRMGEVDPHADIQLELACPGCGHRWTASVDPASFLWAELDVWARRTLGEVHALASAYGWREADILGLSPTRRRLYLDMIGGPISP